MCWVAKFVVFEGQIPIDLSVLVFIMPADDRWVGAQALIIPANFFPPKKF